MPTTTLQPNMIRVDAQNTRIRLMHKRFDGRWAVSYGHGLTGVLSTGTIMQLYPEHL